MNVTAVAATALQAASTATAVRAHNIANAQTDGYTALAPVTGGLVRTGAAVFVQDTGAPVNLIAERIGLLTASIQYEAAARVTAADAELQRRTLRAFA
jgi:flagellar basal body rod protein FlgC